MNTPGKLWMMLAALVACAVGTLGCGGGAATSNFDVPQERRTTLSAVHTAENTIRLPAEVAFNIHDKASEQTPGTDGAAHGESDASAAGTAHCRVRVENGGQAKARFDLGHCLENRGEAPMLVEAAFDVDYAVTLTPDPLGDVKGSYLLEAIVNDTDGRTLKRVQIENSAEMEGGLSASSKSTKRFSVQLEPGRVYNFYLAGRVEATSKPGTLGELRIEIRQVNLTLVRRPAPASR